ncbi:hypothetical protein KIW84_055022 [Lathyrus oleraceus]|uniref:rRNA adenine N(6)-methyltransferase n=1 Tax=Pisum sativum TaxID=3888 RepID=A0A9D4WZI8_PEA|nr:hypothetical protein KIW84_055022 [Pisum sativum]
MADLLPHANSHSLLHKPSPSSLSSLITFNLHTTTLLRPSPPSSFIRRHTTENPRLPQTPPRNPHSEILPPPYHPSSSLSGTIHRTHRQHILKNPLLVDSIVQKSRNKTTNVVLEIGLGSGNVTKKLLDAGKKVIVFEIDSRMVLELHKQFQGVPSSRLTIIQEDVTETTLKGMGKACLPCRIRNILKF